MEEKSRNIEDVNLTKDIISNMKMYDDDEDNDINSESAGEVEAFKVVSAPPPLTKDNPISNIYSIPLLIKAESARNYDNLSPNYMRGVLQKVKSNRAYDNLRSIRYKGMTNKSKPTIDSPKEKKVFSYVDQLEIQKRK